MTDITDWLMVIITAIYVLATILIWRANAISAQATREQVAEARKQFEESNRAFVAVSFEVIRGGLLVLCIQNSGKRIANNVSIKIADSFIKNASNIGREHLQRLCDSSFVLGIGQCWYVTIGGQSEIKELSNEILQVDLSYQDTMGEYTDTIRIDLKQLFWALQYNSPEEDIYKEIKKSNEALLAIGQALKK